MRGHYLVLVVVVVIILGELLHSLYFYEDIKKSRLDTISVELHSHLLQSMIDVDKKLLIDSNKTEDISTINSQALEDIADKNGLWQISFYRQIGDQWFLVLSSEIEEYFANGSKDSISKFGDFEELTYLQEPLFSKEIDSFDITYTVVKNFKIDTQNLLAIVQKKDTKKFISDDVLDSIIYGLLLIFLYIPTASILIFRERILHNRKIKRFAKVLEFITRTKKRDRAIKDSIHNGVIILNENLKISYANRYIVSRMDYKRSEVIGKHIYSIVDSSHHQVIKSFLDQENENRNARVNVKLKDRLGKVVNFLLEKRRVEYANSSKERVLILVDNSAILMLKNELGRLHQNMETKIEEKVRYTRGILDSQNTLIFVCSKNRIYDANRAFLDFFGNFEDVEEFRKSKIDVFDKFEKVKEEGYVYNFKHKDLMAYLLINKNYKHKVKIKSAQRSHIFNITADYFEHQDEYEKIGNEQFIVSLSDITEFELLRKEEINLAKLTSIGKLTAGITHEINTPLTYMKGNIEIAKLDAEDIDNAYIRENISKNLANLDDGVKRLESIVKSMQEFVGYKDSQKENVDITSTILVSLRMLYNKIKHISNVYINGKKFSIELESGDFGELFSIMGIKQKLEQVWIIILNNALDEFSSSNKPFEDRLLSIDIKEEYGSVIIVFADNAGGIDEGIIDKIFDPLISTKTSSGMGLGLNIAKKIIEEHHGTIKARNTGDGALFELRF